MQNRRGNALIQYLMFIALVAAVAVPIFVSRFGDPLIQTFKNERGKFVAIIAQTPKGRRKPPVPAEWFSKTPTPNLETDEISGGEQLSDGQAIETGEVSSGGKIQTGQVGGGSGAGGDQGIQTGSIQTGEGSGGRYSGAGTSGGGMSGGDDFFSKPPAAPGEKLRGEGEAASEGARSGRASGAGSDGDGNTGRGDDAGVGKKDNQEKSKNEGDGTKLGEGKKKSLIEAENELNERTKAKKFDWWLIIKILIVILIVALVFLILIGNSRK